MDSIRHGKRTRALPHARIVNAGLAALVLVQLALLAWSLRPIVLRVVQFQGLPAVERSARVAFGDRFSDFLAFVSENVPPEDRIVLPPLAVDAAFGDVGLMQYLLFPREIINCPAGPDLPACVRSLTGDETCILRVGEFPAPQDVPESKEYMPFDDERGLYCPG